MSRLIVSLLLVFQVYPELLSSVGCMLQWCNQYKELVSYADRANNLIVVFASSIREEQSDGKRTTHRQIL